MVSFSTLLQNFQAQLSTLELIVSQAHPDALSLKQHFLVAQQQFQSEILGEMAGIEDDLSERAQPILIEMNRTLRLMGMDIAFLQAARQPLTMQQRQKQLRDRILQLQTFCQGLLNLNNLSEANPLEPDVGS